MTGDRRAVGGWVATRSIAGLTWTRLWRGRAIWVSGFLAALPVLIASVVGRNGPNPGGIDDVLEVSIWLLAIMPALHLASSLSDELEERTAAYLWSRPIPRWTIITGKMLALIPLVAAMEILGAVIAGQRLGALGTTMTVDRVAIGLGLGVFAASCCSLGISTLWPKHGMAISMVYILFVDLAIGVIPASLQNLSITHHVRSIIDQDGQLTATPLIGLGAIALVWLAVALSRIRRLE